jgi:hypothetical protein
MAEQEQHVRPAPGVSTPPPPAPPVPEPGPLAAAPEAGGAEEPYRSLSVLALIGFGIAALYSGVVILMGLVALMKGKPMLMSGWALLLPLAAVVLCGLARWRIARSEDTLAGTGLARWGILLSVFVSLTYLAYFSAVYFALKQQSEDFARRWLGLVRDGELLKAAFYSMKPVQRVGVDENSPEVSRLVEGRMPRSEEPGAPSGAVAQFRQLPFVSLIEQSGRKAEFEPVGVESWGFVQGGFEVTWRYRVRTPDCAFTMLVTVHGSEAPHDEYPGRQWNVDLGPSKTVMDSNPEFTEHGRRQGELDKSARDFLLQRWKPNLTKLGKQEAFLDTRPAERRGEEARTLEVSAKLGLIAGAPGVARSARDLEVFADYRRFLAGGFVTEDPKRFRAAGVGEVVRGEMRKLFAADSATLPPVFEPGGIPDRVVRDGRIEYGITVTVAEPPAWMAETTVYVEGDARALESEQGDPNWRIARLVLHTGRKPPPGPPPGAGRGGMRGLR